MHHPFLCSDGGEIRHILLFVPEYEAEHFALSYGALIASMASTCQFTLIAEPEALVYIEQWPISKSQADKLTIISAAKHKLTAWARDPALALSKDGRSDSGVQLLASKALDRSNDLAALKLLADKDGFLLLDADIDFEGGNMLFGKDHVFIGADTINALDNPAMIDRIIPENARKIIIGCSKAPPVQLTRKAMACQDEWREIFHFHNAQGTRQPIFHIDMFISLAGKDKDGRQVVLVGDPALAAEILEKPLHPLSLSEYFDEVADELTAQGFAVIRNPLPMIYKDDIDARERTWFYASSNNVLVQKEAEKVSAVWVPQYGHDHWPELSKTDAYISEIWDKLGFTVHPIPDGQRLAENLGGLHCLTNVLQRG